MEAGNMVIVLAFIGIIGIVLLLLFLNKIHIDWGSIIRKTIALDTAVFGVYCFCGKQGSGKTYSLTKYILKEHNGRKIYSNVNSLRGVDFEPITSVQHLLSLRDEKKVIIIYDEILNLLNDKTIPRDIRDDLMEFLSQQRKQKNILITTAQEWLNIPIEFRRFVRIQVDCATVPLGKFGGILIEEYFDAYRMKWSQLDNEYVAPRISKKFSKYEKRFMESYDTYERVRKLKRS
jgi:ATPase family associated with various cellular activities (AAA)